MKAIRIFVLGLLLLFLCGCTVSGNHTPVLSSIGITLTPNSTSAIAGGTVQFTATVSGTSNTGITWSATGGSISSTGLYTAPNTPGPYTVKATSVADTTKSASATVTVSGPATIVVSMSPVSVSLAPGGTQQFTATVTGSSNSGVTWKTSGGTITASGLYTAPATAAGYTVSATSVADPTKTATASVSVQAAVQHTVNLSWSASSSAVAGYNVYRGTQSEGPYGLLNASLIAGLSYADSTVVSGTAYYYVVTAVSSTGAESAFSNQSTAVIPVP